MNDLSGAVVAARLSAMAKLSREYRDSPEGSAAIRKAAREALRTQYVDMSPAAIASRIHEMAELRRLCLSLGAARPRR